MLDAKIDHFNKIGKGRRRRSRRQGGRRRKIKRRESGGVQEGKFRDESQIAHRSSKVR